eukprot:2888157-Amphidinium_carterae.1
MNATQSWASWSVIQERFEQTQDDWLSSTPMKHLVLPMLNRFEAIHNKTNSACKANRRHFGSNL